MTTHTNLTATEVLKLQREFSDEAQAKMDDAWVLAFREAHAKGLADAVDDLILEALVPQFGEGIYDYK